MYKGSLRRHVTLGHDTILSLGQHRHRLDAGQRPLRRPEALKAKYGPGRALDPAVVLLDPVIEPASTLVPGEAPQLADERTAPARKRYGLVMELPFARLVYREGILSRA